MARIERRTAGIRKGIRVSSARWRRSSAIRDGLGTSLTFRRLDTPGSLSFSPSPFYPQEGVVIAGPSSGRVLLSELRNPRNAARAHTRM